MTEADRDTIEFYSKAFKPAVPPRFMTPILADWLIGFNAKRVARCRRRLARLRAKMLRCNDRKRIVYSELHGLTRAHLNDIQANIRNLRAYLASRGFV